jgi:hypothetical protein
MKIQQQLFSEYPLLTQRNSGGSIGRISTAVTFPTILKFVGANGSFQL